MRLVCGIAHQPTKGHERIVRVDRREFVLLDDSDDTCTMAVDPICPDYAERVRPGYTQAIDRRLQLASSPRGTHLHLDPELAGSCLGSR